MKFSLGKNDPGVQRWINIQKQAVPRCMRWFMVKFYSLVTVSTPVDTGRARYSWECSISSVNPAVAPEGTYGLDTTRATSTFTVSAVTGKDTLYVSNNLPYIGRLDRGYSKQAPARFVELAFEDAKKALDIYVKNKGWSSEI